MRLCSKINEIGRILSVIIDSMIIFLKALVTGISNERTISFLFKDTLKMPHESMSNHFPFCAQGTANRSMFCQLISFDQRVSTRIYAGLLTICISMYTTHTYRIEGTDTRADDSLAQSIDIRSALHRLSEHIGLPLLENLYSLPKFSPLLSCLSSSVFQSIYQYRLDFIALQDAIHERLLST